MALVSQNGIVSTLDPTNSGGLNVTGTNIDYGHADVPGPGDR